MSRQDMLERQSVREAAIQQNRMPFTIERSDGKAIVVFNSNIEFRQFSTGPLFQELFDGCNVSFGVFEVPIIDLYYLH